MESENDKLWSLFAEVIKERGIMKSWVADKLMLNPSTVSLFINGKRPLSEKNRIRLNELLGTSIGDKTEE